MLWWPLSKLQRIQTLEGKVNRLKWETEDLNKRIDLLKQRIEALEDA